MKTKCSHTLTRKVIRDLESTTTSGDFWLDESLRAPILCFSIKQAYAGVRLSIMLASENVKLFTYRLCKNMCQYGKTQHRAAERLWLCTGKANTCCRSERRRKESRNVHPVQVFDYEQQQRSEQLTRTRSVLDDPSN